VLNQQPYDQEFLLDLYRTMLKIRLFEMEIKRLYGQGRVRGAVHLCIGQEAVAAGVCKALRPTDWVASTHRGHGHFLAKGGDLKGIMAELMGKAAGCSRGCGGSMHLFAPPIGFLGGNGIVGAGLPLALGAAFSAAYRRTDEVAAAFFGDGASNQGVVHETLNLAALWKLPLLAVCENNAYAATTPAAQAVSVSDIAVRAQGYGMPGLSVDGNDCLAVYEATAEAAARARAGQGPTLIECKTYRVEAHCGIIADRRPRLEREPWQAERDPLAVLARRIPGLTAARDEAIRRSLRDELGAALEFAEQSPPPHVADFLRTFAGL